MSKPIYQTIIEKIKTEIESLAPNTPIASERELSEHYQVSRMTVRKAITELVEEGYLYRDGNIGTFIADRKLRRNRPESNVFQNIDEEKDYKIIYFDVKSDDREINEMLEIPLQDQYIRIVRLNRVNSKPESVDEIYIVRQMVDQKQMDDISSLLKFSSSIDTGSVHQKFIPTAIPLQYANLLGLKINTPIILIESTIVTKNGKIYAIIRSFTNPNVRNIEITV